jgi:starch synthase
VRVLHVASEVAPFSKTGGLADVSNALPRATAKLGMKVAVVMPRYRAVDPTRWSLARRLRPLPVPLGEATHEVTVYEGRLPGSDVVVYAVDHAPSFDREGIYGDASGDYLDNYRRYALLCRAALEIGEHMWGGFDLLHAHDWQTGLGPFMIARGWLGRRPATVLTLHNMAFQGLAPHAAIAELGLGADVWSPEGLEFYGQVSLLKAGIVYSDRLTTVSPRYAREIQTPDEGYGMDGLLRANARKLTGILNGADYDVWSPERDTRIAARFSAKDPSGKARCKEALQRELELPERPDIPLVGAISRITDQKGFDLVIEAADELAHLDAQFVILGSGTPVLEDRLRKLGQRFPTKVSFRNGYDEALAHRIEAGSDLFLMPSRFEPCGLTQLYALRYGTVPLVRATGGLDDSVVDFDPQTATGTGFKFTDYSAKALVATLKRALGVYRTRDLFRELRQRAMGVDFSWGASARRYADVYAEALREAAQAKPS